jgi:predicted nucleic acid-binding protein
VPKYLLDTNVLSEVVKKRPSATVIGHLREVPQTALHASVVSVMEMRFGAVRSATGSILWERIRRDVLRRVKILPLGEDEASRAGEILADLEMRGVPVGIEDVMIGATALVHGLVVVTRNVKHLGRIRGLVVENWWEE